MVGLHVVEVNPLVLRWPAVGDGAVALIRLVDVCALRHRGAWGGRAGTGRHYGS